MQIRGPPADLIQVMGQTAASSEGYGLWGLILLPVGIVVIFGGVTMLFLVLPDTKKAMDIKIADKMASLPARTLWFIFWGVIAVGEQFKTLTNPILSWIFLPVFLATGVLTLLGIHRQKRDKGEL